MTVIFDREPYGLRVLRRAATNDYSANLLPSEAADVVAVTEALVAQVSLLQQEARIRRAIGDGLAAEVERLLDALGAANAEAALAARIDAVAL